MNKYDKQYLCDHLDSGNQLLFQKRLLLFYFCQQAAVLVCPEAMSNIDLYPWVCRYY